MTPAATGGRPCWAAPWGMSAALATYYDDFSDPVYYGLFIPSAVLFPLWQPPSEPLSQRLPKFAPGPTAPAETWC